MKYVQVPETIPIKIPNPCPLCRSSVGDNSTKIDPWSFIRYLENIVLEDPALGTGYEPLKARKLVVDQFRDATSGEWIGVEEAHLTLLKSIVIDPKGGNISSGILVQFFPFMDAIIEAKDTKPVEK